jgi:hypothetical protein
LYEQLALAGFARIFLQNKADDAANPLWIGKGNIVAHLTQLCEKNRSKDG